MTNENKRLDDYLSQMVEQNQYKRDEFIDFSRLRMSTDGSFHTIKQVEGIETIDTSFGNFRMTDWAATQLCKKINMPYRYYENCPPLLRQQNVNHWLERKNSKKVMMRLRERNGETVIRGLLSAQYSRIDNHVLLGIVNDFMELSNHEYEIDVWKPREDSFHLRIIFNNTIRQVGFTPDGQPDIHKIGVHIINSEVGKSHVRVIPLVYRLVCKNGLMAWVQDGVALKQRHYGLSKEEMREKVAISIGEAFRMGQQTINVLEKSKEVEINNPYEIIERIVEKNKYSEKTANLITEKYNKENDGTLFYLVQSITDAAHEVSDDDRVDMEQEASILLRALTKVA